MAYDRLVAFGPKENLVPYLAKSWKFPDSASVVFDLRTDVKCTDGTPLTAAAVGKSLTRFVQRSHCTDRVWYRRTHGHRR